MLNNKAGVVVVLSGLSGSGKSHLTNILVENGGFLHVPSITTRPPRAGEQHGFDRIFCTEEEFDLWGKRGDLICVKRMFNHWYAISTESIEQYVKGMNIITQLRYTSLVEMKSRFPVSVCVYVWPASLERIAEKLSERQLLTSENINSRLSENDQEINFMHNDMRSTKSITDYHFINDYSSTSERQFLNLISLIIQRNKTQNL